MENSNRFHDLYRPSVMRFEVQSSKIVTDGRSSKTKNIRSPAHIKAVIPSKIGPNKMQVLNVQLFIWAIVFAALVRGHAVEKEQPASHGAYERRYLMYFTYLWFYYICSLWTTHTHQLRCTPASSGYGTTPSAAGAQLVLHVTGKSLAALLCGHLDRIAFATFSDSIDSIDTFDTFDPRTPHRGQW